MRIFILLSLLYTLLFSDAHVLVYHRFEEPKHENTSISISKLREHFEFLKKNGYEVVPMSRLVDAVGGVEPVGNNWIVFAIDDGYRSFYEHALPIFREYNYPFTLFVYVKATHDKYGDFMNFDQILECSKYGEIGLHSYSHSHMLQMSDSEVREDFRLSYDLLSKAIGNKKLKYYAYPYGEYNDRILSIANEFKFDAIFNQNSGAVSDLSNLHDLERVPLNNSTPLKVALASEYMKVDWTLLPIGTKNLNNAKAIRISTNTNATTGKLYISGWDDFKTFPMNNGVLEYKFKNPIKRNNVRIVLKIGRKASTKIYTKDIYAK